MKKIKETRKSERGGREAGRVSRADIRIQMKGIM